MSRPTTPKTDYLSISDVSELINALEEMIKDSPAIQPTSELSSFSVGRIPKIKLDTYFQRMIKYCKLEVGTYIALMIYLDKAAESIHLTGYNIHRIILAAMVAAIKYTCDLTNNNAYYAKVGGISVDEMNLVETSFLVLLDYNLYISSEEYEKYSSFIRS